MTSSGFTVGRPPDPTYGITAVWDTVVGLTDEARGAGRHIERESIRSNPLKALDLLDQALDRFGASEETRLCADRLRAYVTGDLEAAGAADFDMREERRDV